MVDARDHPRYNESTKALPEWTSDYKLGNRRIDQEHQKLMELLLWLERELLSEQVLDRLAHRRDHDHWRRRVKEHLEALVGSVTELEMRGHLARVLLVGKSFWEEHFHTFDRRIADYLGK